MERKASWLLTDGAKNGCVEIVGRVLGWSLGDD
jgi:hypothetical protein